MPVTWGPDQQGGQDIEANFNGIHPPRRLSSGGLTRREKRAIDETKLSDEQRERLRTWKDAIQPHTDEGGDAYYIGDAYEGIDAECLLQWEVEKYALLT